MRLVGLHSPGGASVPDAEPSPGSPFLDEPTEHVDEPLAPTRLADLPAAIEGRIVLVPSHRSDQFEDPAWTRGPELVPAR